METIRVTFSKNYLKDNLQEYEVYMSALPDQEWDCPKPIIDGFQIFRDFYGVAMLPNSGFRPNDPYGKGSAHDYANGDKSLKYGLAMDIVPLPTTHGQPSKITPIEVINDYNGRVKKWISGEFDELIDKLRAVGITGFGIEGACIHYECGGYGVKHRIPHTDKYGTYTAFIWTGFGPNDINKAL